MRDVLRGLQDFPDTRTGTGLLQILKNPKSDEGPGSAREKIAYDGWSVEATARSAPRLWLEEAEEMECGLRRGDGVGARSSVSSSGGEQIIRLRKEKERTVMNTSDAARERKKRLIEALSPAHPVLTSVKQKEGRWEEDRGAVTGTGTPSWANKVRRSVVSGSYEAGKEGAVWGKGSDDIFEAARRARESQRERLGMGGANSAGEGSFGVRRREEGRHLDFFEERERRVREGSHAARYSPEGSKVRRFPHDIQ